MLDLAQARELHGLGNDFTAKRFASNLGIRLARCTAHQRREPRAPHAPLVERDVLAGYGPAKFEAGIIFLVGYQDAYQAVVWVAQVFAPKACLLPTLNGKTLVDTLEI